MGFNIMVNGPTVNGIDITDDTPEYWGYANTRHATLEDAEATAVAMKNTLENRPTTYINVRQVAGSAESGWSWATDRKLTDTEIVNLSGEGLYYSSSQFDSEAIYGQTVDEVKARVIKCRNLYGTSLDVDTIYQRINESGDWYTVRVIEHTPSIDLSAYVNRE